MFITTDAQLLRFQAAAVRPQGRAAGGMAGIRLSAGAAVVWFGAVPDPAGSPGTGPGAAGGAAGDAVVVTVAGSSHALPGTAAATVKVTPYQEYPAKGRATGGVRCHRFLKGEDIAGARLGRPGAGPGRDRGGRPGLPARRGRPPGRLRGAHPAGTGRPGRYRTAPLSRVRRPHERASQAGQELAAG